MIVISQKLDIRSMDTAEITRLAEEMNQPKFRAAQLFKWLQSGVESFDEMTDMPLSLRRELSKRCYIANVKIVKRYASAIDETVKYVYELFDGEWIESVLMKYEHGYTICISTQVGCRMNCSFCASCKDGLSRNLTASEMLAQITATQADNKIRISNVVMMGMGEPLDNFENTEKFLRLVSDEKGLNIGLRHISLSTSGVVTGIKRLEELKLPITLSISLHAPFDEMRSSLMPVNKKWCISELLRSCKEYQSVTGRRISFEYALIEGVNDTKECAEELAVLLKGIMCHVNLIPANPIKENTYKKPSRKNVLNFQSKLVSLGINATVRRTLGSDIDASCGQLRKKAREECDK